MSQAPDQTFELFAKHWNSREPVFHLDDPEVREQLMTLLSATMSLLAVAPPEVWATFMQECSTTANTLVPEDVKQQIKGAVAPS
jgi:hypothetical protein